MTWLYVLVAVLVLVLIAAVLLGLALFGAAKRSEEWRRQHGWERRR